ncbi:uncharacterized protein LOC143028967 [Oratosquilla oratoria]|uniref:uncharacterized protein LOC143028967 n=1 Tax=Oratosquilla oratoria TaxID=337810 RepID=UPI003F75A54C
MKHLQQNSSMWFSRVKSLCGMRQASDIPLLSQLPPTVAVEQSLEYTIVHSLTQSLQYTTLHRARLSDRRSWTSAPGFCCQKWQTQQSFETSKGTRGSIVSLHIEGLPNVKISQKLGVSLPMVARWIQRYHLTGATDNRPRAGRPRCTTEEEDQAIASMTNDDPFCKAHDIHGNLRLSCSLETIRARHRERGLHARTPAKKPELTPINMEKRMEYALQYADKPLAFWDNVIFCDEKTFSSEGTNTARYVWRPKNTRFESENVISSRRSGRLTAGLFGWMHASGVGELTDVGPGRFTGSQGIYLWASLKRFSCRQLGLWYFMMECPSTLFRTTALSIPAELFRIGFADTPT